MDITLLKCKLHNAVVSHAELQYDGSCAIDKVLLDSANIHAFEQIHIYNIDNGERFVSYALSAEANSGIISLNGAAARKGLPGDRLIICAYASIAEEYARKFSPTLIYLDEQNRIVRKQKTIPAQAA